LKSVSAFANERGDGLIFGIADDKTIVRLDDIKTLTKLILDSLICTTTCPVLLLFYQRNLWSERYQAVAGEFIVIYRRLF